MVPTKNRVKPRKLICAPRLPRRKAKRKIIPSTGALHEPPPRHPHRIADDPKRVAPHRAPHAARPRVPAPDEPTPHRARRPTHGWPRGRAGGAQAREEGREREEREQRGEDGRERRAARGREERGELRARGRGEDVECRRAVHRAGREGRRAGRCGEGFRGRA